MPLAVAVGAFGVSFGVLARSAGMGSLAPLVMSATTFAGSAQFAVASILSAGGGTATAVAAAVLLNARYLPIGISVAAAFRGRPWRRFLSAQLVVDESWALATDAGGRVDLARLMGAGAAIYGAWNLGTALGVLGGDVLGDPERLGLDAAFPALFLALLVPQLRDDAAGGRARAPAVAAASLGAAVALACVPFAPAGVPIIAASAACLVGLLGRRR